MIDEVVRSLCIGHKSVSVLNEEQKLGFMNSRELRTRLEGNTLSKILLVN